MNKRQRAARKRKAKRLRSMLWTIPQIAEQLKTSQSTVYRDLLPDYCERNRVQCRERKRGNLKPFSETRCRVCTVQFVPDRSDRFLCDSPLCRSMWASLRKIWVPLSADLLREHVAHYGGVVTEEIAERVGLTVSELIEAIKDERDC